jgi:hypothetical protein
VVYALFVGLDVANLTTVGAFALGACAFAAATRNSVGWGVASRCSGDTFLLLASETALFVSIEATELVLEAAENM